MASPRPGQDRRRGMLMHGNDSDVEDVMLSSLVVFDYQDEFRVVALFKPGTPLMASLLQTAGRRGAADAVEVRASVGGAEYAPVAVMVGGSDMPNRCQWVFRPPLDGAIADVRVRIRHGEACIEDGVVRLDAL